LEVGEEDRVEEQVKWQGGEHQQDPEKTTSASDTCQVVQTGDSNVESGALRVGLGKLLAIRGAEDLHAVVTRAKEQRAKHISQQVDPHVQAPHSCATPLKQCPDGSLNLDIRTCPHPDGDGEGEKTY
jgi:hypothetical protein